MYLMHSAIQLMTDLLFQPLFDELLTPPPSVDPPAPKVIAPIDEVSPLEHAESTGSPTSKTVDQVAPLPSKSQTIPETQPSVIPNDVEEINHDIEVAHMGNNSLFGMLIPEVASDQSSSTVSSYTIVHPDYQIPQHNSKWTKDHPLENIIGQLARPVSTRLQLQEQAIFCYYDAFLTFVEPKTYKDALTQSCWIEAMQEELNEFEWLEDLLFQSLFDELLNPPPSFDNQDAEVIAPVAEVIPQVNDDSTSLPSSTAVDQDAPSPSKSPTPTETQSSAILQDVGNDNLDIEVAHMGNDPLPVELKTYKEALTQACWIEAMQEELHEFERLEIDANSRSIDGGFIALVVGGGVDVD
nr:integrase, catalytic region, zinc finger, CCHC-type, peptidase aspartic, catalytic [Tanacetum cinerariifolium]